MPNVFIRRCVSSFKSAKSHSTITSRCSSVRLVTRPIVELNAKLSARALTTHNMINPTLSEWLNLIFRWIHVFAAIMWVGTTYYFTWLDARLTEEEKAVANTGTAAQIWMVHSGGFYVVEKRKVPDLASRTLHWFRWEAGTTWLSGMALLILVYYLGGGALIDPDIYDLSLAKAVGLGIGLLLAGWIIYDLIMISALGRN